MTRLARIVALLCALSVWRVEASAWPDIDTPPGAKGQIVAADMKLNGVPMRIKQFTSPQGVPDVVAFYQTHWTQGKLKPVTNTVGEWKVVGRQLGDHYLTVQVRPLPSGGSEGFVAASLLPMLKELPALDTQFPRLPGTEVLTDADSNDGGMVAKTLVLKNAHSVVSNASFYESTLPANDWKRNRSFGGAQDHGQAYVLHFERRREAASIAISPDPQGGTVVVINIVAKGL